MNENHQRLCPSPEWAEFLHTDVLPPLVARVELGQRMLEVGPGPGAATEWLRHRVPTLVAIEIDPMAADKLRERFVDSNVTVITGDATSLDAQDASFDSASCFTMLHHVPTVDLQDALFREVARVLKPGSTFFGSDSAPSDNLRTFHEGDTYNPIPTEEFEPRLIAAGFSTASAGHRGWGNAFVAVR